KQQAELEVAVGATSPPFTFEHEAAEQPLSGEGEQEEQKKKRRRKRKRGGKGAFAEAAGDTSPEQAAGTAAAFYQPAEPALAGELDDATRAEEPAGAQAGEPASEEGKKKRRRKRRRGG